MTKDSILRKPAVRERTGLAQTTIDVLEKKGGFPRRRNITEKTVGWSEREIDRWINEKLHGSTA